MRSHLEFSPAAARALQGILFDLDDTVLDHGRLAPETLATFAALRDAGLRLVGVTGRPASWGQVLLRQWPVDAMVTENGALALWREGAHPRQLERLTQSERAVRRGELAGLARAIEARFVGLRLTDDSIGRYADASFDIRENVDVPDDVVAAATQFALEHGARVVRSSIHLHVCFEEDDKATGTLRLLQHAFGISRSEALRCFAFVGDSENDASCFAAFYHSFGVANLRGRPTVTPRYRASLPMSAGFRQIAAHVLSARGALPQTHGPLPQTHGAQS